VEVNCGPDGFRVCTAFYSKPANYTPSAPLGFYVHIKRQVFQQPDINKVNITTCSSTFIMSSNEASIAVFLVP